MRRLPRWTRVGPRSYRRHGELSFTQAWSAAKIAELIERGEYDILTAAWEWLRAPDDARRHKGRWYR